MLPIKIKTLNETKKKSFLLEFLTALPVMIITGLIIIFFLNKIEQKECLYWQERAKTEKSFSLTEWQKGQCDHHSISIDAPVRASK